VASPFLTPWGQASPSPLAASILSQPPRKKSYGEQFLDELSTLSLAQGASLPFTGPLTALGGATKGLSFGLLDPTQEIAAGLGSIAPPTHLRSALEVAGEIGGSFVPYIGAASVAGKLFRGADLSARLLRGATTFGAPEVLRQVLQQELQPKDALRSIVSGAAFSLPLPRLALAPVVAASELALGSSLSQAGTAGAIALLFGPMEGHRVTGEAAKSEQAATVFEGADPDVAAIVKLGQAQRLRNLAPDFPSTPRPAFNEAPASISTYDLFKRGPFEPPLTPTPGKHPIKAAAEAAQAAFERSKRPEFKSTPRPEFAEDPIRGFAIENALRPKSQVELIEEAAFTLTPPPEPPPRRARRKPKKTQKVLPFEGPLFGESKTLSGELTDVLSKGWKPTARKKPPKGKGFDPEYHSIHDAVLMKGGIKIDANSPIKEEIRSLDTRRTEGTRLNKKGERVRQAGRLTGKPLVSKKGKSIEEMIVALREDGFDIPEDRGIDEFLRMLEKDIFSKKEGTEAGRVYSKLRQFSEESLTDATAAEEWAKMLELQKLEEDAATSFDFGANVGGADALKAELEAEAARVKLLSTVDETKLSASLTKSVEVNGTEAPATKTIQRALAEKRYSYVPANAPTANIQPPQLRGVDLIQADPTSPFVSRALREKAIQDMRAQGQGTKAAQLEQLWAEARSEKQKPLDFREANRLLKAQEKILSSPDVTFASNEEALKTARQELSSLSPERLDSFVEELPTHYQRGDEFVKSLKDLVAEQKRIAKMVGAERPRSSPESSLAADASDFGVALDWSGKSTYGTINGQNLGRTFKSPGEALDFLRALENGTPPENLAQLRALAYPRGIVVDFDGKALRVTNQATGETIPGITSLAEAEELVRNAPRLLDAAPELMPPSVPRVPGPGNIGGLATEQAPPSCPTAPEDYGGSIDNMKKMQAKLVEDVQKGPTEP